MILGIIEEKLDMEVKELYKVRTITDFRDMINQSVDNFGKEAAFKLKNASGEYQDLSYKDFRNDIHALGAAMYSLGMNGSKIAVMGMNSYRWILTYLATTIGANVIVPIDKELMFDDIKTIIEVSEAKYLFADTKSIAKLEENRNLLPEDLQIIIMDSEKDLNQDWGFGRILNTGRELVRKKNKAYKNYLKADVNPDACSVIIFTSGTSGLAKGVMLSQHNICFDIMAVSKTVKIGVGDRLLSVLPIHHTFECTLGILLPLYSGCCISFCEGLLHLMKNMQEVEPTIFMTVPLMMEKIHARILKAASEKKGGKLALTFGKVLAATTNVIGVDMNDKIFSAITKNFGGKLRLLIVGAAAVRPDVVKDFKMFGIPTLIGYGLTECSPLVAGNNDQLMTIDTVGVPMPGVEIKIINKDAQGLGEICVKGENVMLGYYKDEELTREVIDEYGWFHTGDLGYIDEENLLRINGRIKNVIVTKNGKNIYPEEIEYHLNNNPLIAEAMVVGADSPDGQETVVEAKIFPDINAIKEKSKSKETPTREEITKIMSDVIREINKKLPNYKSIRRMNIRDDEFEKTTTAKIKRYANMDDKGSTSDIK